MAEDIAISVQGVYKDFHYNSNRNNSIKGVMTNIFNNGGNHAPMNAIAASSVNGSIFCHDKRVKMIVKMISLVETEGRKDRNDRKVETDTQ